MRHTPAKLLRAFDRRLKKSRAGSVLILCVALLVLLALIGTAMISTSRVDRYSSVQHTYNTEIDLLMDGAKAMAEAAVVNDLWDTSNPAGQRYRPPGLTTPSVSLPFAANNYDHFDGPTVTNVIRPPSDNWLASRYPERPDPFLPVTPTTNDYMWRVITSPLVSTLGVGTPLFEAPYAPGGAQNGRSLPRRNLVPTSLLIGTKPYPAFRSQPFPTPWLAADADGDGIADSCYVRLPVGEIDGVAYYAAFRIIDNCAAINVNSAWSNRYTFNFTYNTNSTAVAATNVDDPGGGGLGGVLGFYRTDISLLERLHTFNRVPNSYHSTEMKKLLAFRLNGSNPSATPAIAPDPTPAPEKIDTGGPSPQNFTYTFGYANESDALEHILVQRMDNPDNSTVGGAQGGVLSLSDQTALAAHYCVRSADSSLSTLESLLNESLVTDTSNPFSFGSISVSTSPYAPTDADLWYLQNFYWDAPGIPGPATIHLPLRSMLVTRNPVSNLTPVVTNPLPANGTIAQIGALSVQTIGTGVPGTSLPADGRVLPGMARYLYNPGVVARPLVPKADINKALFPELWRAYWSVMADYTPDPAALTTYEPPFQDTTTAGADGKMFRSPSRNLPRPGSAGTPPAGVVNFTGSMVMQLRSALAAVNAIDLRDHDETEIVGNPRFTGTGDITSREIPIYDFNDSHRVANPDRSNGTFNLAYTVRVYGTEKQPFITEVYVNTYTGPQPNSTSGDANPVGYIAVELHNPYNVPLTLNHWAIGLIDRTAGTGGFYNGNTLTVLPLNAAPPPASSGGANEVVPAGYGPDGHFLGGGQIVLPPHSWVVLENYPPNGGGSSGEDAQYRPDEITNAAPALNLGRTVYVPNLHLVLNREMVLLRPHLSAPFGGAPPQGYMPDPASNLTAYTPFPPAAPNPDQPPLYNEGVVAAPRLSDFVPIDSFDFTGVIAPAAPGGLMLHYTRGSGPGINNWKCVYPGLYLATAGLPCREQNADVQSAALTFPPNAAVPTPLLTQPDAPIYPSDFPGVQLNNDDWPSYKPPTATFPFGGFARNGDILQVPFIGAYEIRDASGPAIGAAPAIIYEMNAVTRDCSYVDDEGRAVATNDRTVGDARGAADNFVEQLGRFCPIPLTAASGGVNDYDYSINGYLPQPGGLWMYHFATRLFDYLTVQSPAADYKPNLDPSRYSAEFPGAAATITPVQNGNGPYANPYTSSVPATTLNGEETVGVQGLVNINTAPWWVIASLPLLPPDITATAPDANHNGFPDNVENLAKRIVQYRDGGLTGAGAATPMGPFRSIMDINAVTASAGTPAVPAFQDAITATVPDPDDIDGDVTPYNRATPAPTAPYDHDGVMNDFEQKFLMFNRISNLITTRSDSFTVYILVQGWRNAGTTNPEMVVQRRAAFILDRSNVTAATGAGAAKKTVIPTD